MITISMTQIQGGIMLYIAISIIFFMGSRKDISWINVYRNITRKQFLIRWITCLLIVIIKTSIIVVIEIFKNIDSFTYSLMLDSEAILEILFYTLFVCAIIQRCRKMLYSKFLMISLVILVIFIGFFKSTLYSQIIVLIVCMLPDKKSIFSNLKEK